MKTILKIFTLIIISLVLCLQAFAENFYIENYDVNMVVNQNKQVSVTEDIDAFFTKPSHGIIRKIPHQNATITGIFIPDNKFVKNDSPNSLTIRLGSADKFITGKKHYKIAYSYNYHDNKNEFYHNIIGTNWNVPIKKVHFKVQLPENIDPDKAGLSIGRYGIQGFSGGAEYKIDGNIMTGETFRTLEAREGITFRTSLPVGYFRKYYKESVIYGILVTVLLTLITFFTWYKYGKEDKIIPVVTFELPKGLKNALEAELFMKEKATSTGIIALIIELANKGYIKIEHTKKSFTLTKLKPWDGNNNDVEHRLMTAIFGEKTEVQGSGLSTSHRFYSEYEKIMETLENNRPKLLYEKQNEKITHRVNVCIIGLIFCSLLFFSGFNPAPFLMFDVYSIWATLLLLAMCLYKSRDILFTIGISLLGGYLLLIIGALGYISSEYSPQIWISVICLTIAIICAANMPKKTKIANGIIGQLKGLKKYIKTAEKHQLEQMLESNPDMFYNILPYAYVLGVSSIWLNHFKDMINFSFNEKQFETFTRTIVLASKPSYANGGYTYDSGSSSSYSGSSHSSSGGGGFSGGGGGGGGGSSW